MPVYSLGLCEAVTVTPPSSPSVADRVVEHLRPDHPDVDDVCATSEAPRTKARHRGGGEPHVAPDGDLLRLEVLDVGPADRVGAFLVELGRVEAPHVVCLEDLRGLPGQAAASLRRVGLSASGMTLTSESTGMKFVSPAQRGTTCSWTWSTTPAPAMRPRFQPRLNPCGPIDAGRGRSTPSAASRWISSASSSPSSPSAPTWRAGATIRCPPAYGYLLRRTNASSPRWTTRPSSSSRLWARQKTQPSCSSALLDVLEAPGRPELLHDRRHSHFRQRKKREHRRPSARA